MIQFYTSEVYFSYDGEVSNHGSGRVDQAYGKLGQGRRTEEIMRQLRGDQLLTAVDTNVLIYLLHLVGVHLRSAFCMGGVFWYA